MKLTLILFIALITLSGCVPIMIQKEIQIRKDATGKVVETVEIERATQQGSTMEQLQFDHLKTKETEPKPTAVFPK